MVKYFIPCLLFQMKGVLAVGFKRFSRDALQCVSTAYFKFPRLK